MSEEKGIPVLFLEYNGNEFLPMITPKFMVETRLSLKKFTYRVREEFDNSSLLQDNLYFVYGHLLGKIKSMDVAISELEGNVPPNLVHNRQVFIKIKNMILETIEKQYPQFVDPVLYNREMITH